MEIKFLTKNVPVFSLIYYRIIFGILMCILIFRYFYYNWIFKYFIEPILFFPVLELEWIQPLPGYGMYIIFGVLFLSSIMIMIGLFYRFFSIIFFILFTYFNLIDKTTYLNHYYLISLLSFINIFLPSNSFFSIDSYRKKSIQLKVPNWCYLVIQLQLATVYFFGGVAKIKADWLLEAQPLRLWLLNQSDLFLVGNLLTLPLTAFVFSYFGLIFDLSISFFLFQKKFRRYAYFFVLLFHLATWFLFPIGMFPWVMILGTLIFFKPYWPINIVNRIKQKSIYLKQLFKNLSFNNYKKIIPVKTNLSTKSIASLFSIYFIFQFLFPLRHFMYSDNVSWTEEGFRYSWHIMLAQKTSNIQFYKIISNNKIPISYENLLTKRQFLMMSTQADMIWQFAQFLKEYILKTTGKNVGISCTVYVSLNGKKSELLIDPNLDLTKVSYSKWRHENWISILKLNN